MGSLDAKTDEELVKLVQAGERDIFGVLVRRYEQKIFRYGRRFVYDAENIKDLTQEIFLKAYISINSFDASRRFSPWIYRIAHNEFVNALKKKSWEQVFSFIDLDAILPHLPAKRGIEDAEDRQAIKNDLEKALSRLEPKYRELLILYYYEDLDYKAIAEMLQVPVSTVGVRLRRAKARLKRIMEK